MVIGMTLREGLQTLAWVAIVTQLSQNFDLLGRSGCLNMITIHVLEPLVMTRVDHAPI